MNLLTDIKSTNLTVSDAYVVRPLDLNLNIKTVKLIREDEMGETAHVFISGRIEKPLILVLNKIQRQYLSSLDDHWKSLETIQNNLHLRPTFPIKNKPVIKGLENGWFRYAIKAVIEKNRHTKLNLKSSTHKVILMRKYISLYKRKQNIVIFPP